MSLSENWENLYHYNRHLSRWPWSCLVSRVMHYTTWNVNEFRVLELGCGMGANIPLFKALQVDYYAVEGRLSAVSDIHQKFPELKNKVVCGDFTESIPFLFKFNLIVDRAALTHNTSSNIKRCLKNVHSTLVPGGIYIGIDWYSSKNEYATRGNPLTEDPATRCDFKEGPYTGVGPMRFSSKEEMESFFTEFKILELSHNSEVIVNPTKSPTLSSWHIVGQK